MRYIQVIPFFLIMGILSSCASMKVSEHELFHIQDVYYQSWAIKDLEKGTDIIVEIRNPDPGVEFTKMVFRGIEVDVSVTGEAGKLILKSTVNTGPSVLEDYEYKVTGEDNMLKYKYMGKSFNYPLKNIKRKDTRFME